MSSNTQKPDNTSAGTSVTLSIRLPYDTKEAFVNTCNTRNTSVSYELRNMIEWFVLLSYMPERDVIHAVRQLHKLV